MVAVINTATDTVAGDIKVGPAPRQVVFSPDGSRAYVTTETGVAVIDTASGAWSGRSRTRPGRRASRSARTGRRCTSRTRTPGLWVISAATGQVTARIPAGAEPYAVAVSPDGSRVYVTDMNSDTVSVLATATLHAVATVPVGRLPGSVAVTPDGSQVWVGNNLTGNISVINPATDTVSATISGGSGTATLLAAPLGIAFTKAG